MILNLLNNSEYTSGKITGLQLLSLLFKKLSEESILGFISQTIFSETQNPDDKIRAEAFTTFFKILEALPKTFLKQRGVDIIEGMHKDRVNEVQMIFVWNVPNIATHLSFSDFNSKIFPVFLQNLKHKN